MLGKRQQSVVDGTHACARRPRGRWGKKLEPLKTSASLLQEEQSAPAPPVKCLTDRAPDRPPYPFLARLVDPNALFVRAFGLTGKDRFLNDKEVSLTMKCPLVPAYAFSDFSSPSRCTFLCSLFYSNRLFALVCGGWRLRVYMCARANQQGIARKFVQDRQKWLVRFENGQKAEISEKNLIRIDCPVLNRIDRTAMHFKRASSLPSTWDWPVRSLDSAGLPTHCNFLSKSRLDAK